MLIGSRAIAYWNPEFKVRSNSKVGMPRITVQSMKAGLS